jgi:tRNA(fMet)-specific endonuclease VapC
LRYLLDTNACVDYLNRSYAAVVERIQASAPEDLCLSSVVVAELRYGADKSQRRDENHRRIDILINEILCVDFDAEAAAVFGRIRWDLESRGEPIGPYDFMIAAHALSLDAVLVSDNVRELKRVVGLTLENWREA